MKTKEILKMEMELAEADLVAAKSELRVLTPTDFGAMYVREDSRKRSIELKKIVIPELINRFNSAKTKWQECE